VQFTNTDCPILYDPAEVSQSEVVGLIGNLGLVISAKRLLYEEVTQLKSALKLICAPHLMVWLSNRVMEQSEAFPNRDD
jgi:hypothetical protein